MHQGRRFTMRRGHRSVEEEEQDNIAEARAILSGVGLRPRDDARTALLNVSRNISTSVECYSAVRCVVSVFHSFVCTALSLTFTCRASGPSTTKAGAMQSATLLVSMSSSSSSPNSTAT